MKIAGLYRLDCSSFNCSNYFIKLMTTSIIVVFAGETKKQICDALLNMNKSEKWQKALSAFDVWGFKEIDSSLYQEEKELTSFVKGMSLRPTYY